MCGEPAGKDQLRPIIVNGRAVLNTPDQMVAAATIRIWCKARFSDRLYQVIGDETHKLSFNAVADMSVSNKFILERKR